MTKDIGTNKYKSKDAMDRLNKTPALSAKNKGTNFIIGHVRAKDHAKHKALQNKKVFGEYTTTDLQKWYGNKSRRD